MFRMIKIVAVSMLISNVAFADDDDWDYRRHHRHHHHHHHRHGFNSYYRVYEPPMRYYPAPMQYYMPPPVDYYGYVQPMPRPEHHHRERW